MVPIFLLLGTLFQDSFAGSSNATQVHSLFDSLFKECEEGIKNVSDYVACPKAMKYVFKNYSPQAVLNFLKENEILGVYFEPTLSTEKDGVGEIMKSLRSHLSSLNSVDGIEGKQAKKSFTLSISKIDQALHKAVRNKIVYLDPNTYWAPSVNAKSLVILNEQKKSVTIILHGDTDG